jgi:AmiR/NasT family two-component response regulator
VDVWATVLSIWQAEGVLMELLHVDAAGALLWLARTAAERGESVGSVAAEVGRTPHDLAVTIQTDR